MNKTRLLKLLQIMRTRTDIDHALKISEIISLLEAEGIRINDRKTLYDDFRILGDFGFVIEYDNGYYLSEAPFTLSEIKIIIDSVNSLKNLDDSFLETLKEKLYSFISTYESDLLKSLEYRTKHKDRRFINRLEDCLEAIRNNSALLVTRNGRESEEIVPLFIHRDNDYYYLYYHYLGSEKIYHMRFDNIVSIRSSQSKDGIYISPGRILNHIAQSSRSYSGGVLASIGFEIINDSEKLRGRLQDDFPNIIFTKKGFSIKASVNDVLFSKLTAYRDDIRMLDEDVRKEYVSFLESIITRNSQANRNT